MQGDLHRVKISVLYLHYTQPFYTKSLDVPFLVRTGEVLEPELNMGLRDKVRLICLSSISASRSLASSHAFRKASHAAVPYLR